MSKNSQERHMEACPHEMFPHYLLELHAPAVQMQCNDIGKPPGPLCLIMYFESDGVRS